MSNRPSMPCGRPPKYVKGRDGKPILGFSQSSQGRYYATHSRPRKTFGRDFDVAVMAFRAWEAEQAEYRVIPMPQLTPMPSDEDIQMAAEEGCVMLRRRFVNFHPADVPEDAFYAKCRELIIKSPTQFAERVGIPQIGYLRDLARPEPSEALTGCIERYENKRRKPSPDELRKVKQAWTLFQRCVNPARRLEEITDEQFNAWVDRVFLEYEDGAASPKTVHHRIKRVFTVLNYCHIKKTDQANCSRLLSLIRAIELPALNHENPNPLSREEFHTLLRVAKGTMWESMLVVMLNLCYYPIDVRTLTKQVIDLDTGVVIFRREKKKTTRVGVLWDRSRKLLKDWIENNITTDFVYISNYGTPFTAQGLRNAFRRLRKKAGFDTDVTMDRIRDAAYTAAIQGTKSEKDVKILAGHKLSGESDAYTKRLPQMVIPACKAIEKAYFG